VPSGFAVRLHPGPYVTGGGEARGWAVAARASRGRTAKATNSMRRTAELAKMRLAR